MKFSLMDSNEKRFYGDYRMTSMIANPGILGGGSGSNNETLSMKQAMKIVSELNRIMTSLKTTIENKDGEFINKLSKVWEDKNAVDFVLKHEKSMHEMIDNLNKNMSTFVETVKNIAEAYSKAGGMNLSMTEMAQKLAINVPKDVIKEFFGDGNGDDFGFKDPSKGADQVLDAFQELVTSLEKAISDAINQIKSINAFGNRNVQMNLAQSAGDMVSIVKNNIEENKNTIKEYVDATAQGYTKIGSSAETSAKISAN